MLELLNFFSAFILGLQRKLCWAEVFTAAGFVLKNHSGCVRRSGIVLQGQFPLHVHCVSVNTVCEKQSLYPPGQGLHLFKTFIQ